MNPWKWNPRRMLGAALVVALSAAVMVTILSASLALAGKGGTKGGGGTSEGLTNPALVYVDTDAIITIATADGQQRQALTGGHKGWSISRGSPVWSPDGTMIAYQEDRDNSTASGPMLYVMGADGSNPTLVYTFDGYPERYSTLTWLPGDYIQFTQGGDVRFLDLWDGSVQSLGLSGVGSASVSPDVDPSTLGVRGLIAFAAEKIYLAEVLTNANGTLSLDPATVRRLDLSGRQNHPAISPDGLQIAFYDDAHADGGDTLVVVDLVPDEGGIGFGAVHTLLRGGLGEFRFPPTWSPDSEWIAFNWVNPAAGGNGFGDDGFEIAKIRWDGTEFTNVTASPRHEVAPNWNPAWDSGN